jgi:hypothetical protein
MMDNTVRKIIETNISPLGKNKLFKTIDLTEIDPKSEIYTKDIKYFYDIDENISIIEKK